jgi:hypothetical protein
MSLSIVNDVATGGNSSGRYSAGLLRCTGAKRRKHVIGDKNKFFRNTRKESICY